MKSSNRVRHECTATGCDYEATRAVRARLHRPGVTDTRFKKMCYKAARYVHESDDYTVIEDLPIEDYYGDPK